MNLDEKRLFSAPKFNDAMDILFFGGQENPAKSSETMWKALETLFSLVSDLKPQREEGERKKLWITIPRGLIEDFGNFLQMKKDGEIDSYEAFVRRWKFDYPNPEEWYDLDLIESKDSDGKTFYRGIFINGCELVQAQINRNHKMNDQREKVILELLPTLEDAVNRSMRMLREGTYNAYVDENLPYDYRIGVIKRDRLWKYNPGNRKCLFDGISDETYAAFEEYQTSGMNDISAIGRLEKMTGNDFLSACSIGYKACGYQVDGLSLVDQYMRFADGQDEGLTGEQRGADPGEGIDLMSSEEWDRWYFDANRRGGHPWEVCRGGTYTHVNLYVKYDQGYYFNISGDSEIRNAEVINFYVALKQAGFPVVLQNGDTLLRRMKGEDFVAVGPLYRAFELNNNVPFKEYGKILDLRDLDSDEYENFGHEIMWLPLEPAEFV